MTKRFIQIFGEYDLVISHSGSCGCTVKYHYRELSKGEPEWFRRAQELSSRIYELGVIGCGSLL